MSPRKAIEVLTELIENAEALVAEPLSSPRRVEWARTARAALEKSFATGSSVLEGFDAAQTIGFDPRDNEDELRGIANGALSRTLVILRSAARQLSWEVGEEREEAMADKRVVVSQVLPIFISHSSRDAVLAEAIIELLRSALGLGASEVRCSSVDGYRLPVGVNTEGTLRHEVNAAAVMIGLITPNSLASPFVVFELGARWGSGLFLAPLLAGVQANELSQPLSLLNALSAANEAQLHQFLGDVAKQLGRKLENAASYLKHIERVKQLIPESGSTVMLVPIAKAALPLQVTLIVEGEPPSQRIKLAANRRVSVTHVEYMLSSDVSIVGDDVSFEGETFEVPVNYQALLKVWNTYRPDRNHYDHSGPAKLGVTVSAGEMPQEVVLPIQMEHLMIGNSMYVKVAGSKRISVTAT